MILPAILDPEQRPSIGRSIRSSIRWKRELLYWMLAGGFALWMSWKSHYRSTLPYLPCEDGHCPDPGTREYLDALRIMHEGAEYDALVVPASVLAAALILRALWFVWGVLLVSIFGDPASRETSSESEAPLP